MKTRLLLFSSTALGVLASGCGTLTVNPGDDLRVAVSNPDLELAQRVGTYDLEFTVTGCDDFTADVSVNNGERHTVDAQPLGNGRFRATLPVERLRAPDSYCAYDTRRPQTINGSLAATCKQDGRVTTGHFQVRHAPAWRATYRGRGPGEAVFAGPSPDRFYTTGSGWLESVVSASDRVADVPATTSPMRAPLLVESADRTVRLWSACPINDCGSFMFVDTPTEKRFTGADLIQVFEPDGDHLMFRRNILAPPAAIDLVADGNDALLLSVTTRTTTVSRIGSDAATVVADLEGELEPTKFGLLDGARVFLTQTLTNRLRLRRADGTLVAEVPAPGSGEIELDSLAPSGDAWVTVRGGQAWLSTLDRGTQAPSATATQLESALANLSERRSVGVAWTTSGVVVHDATGVALYERSAPFAKRWSVVLEGSSVVSAVGVGDSVAVLTRTGLRIFDAAGRSTGGADPIDPACALDYAPQHLAVLGSDVVALAGREATYQFKVGAVAMEVPR